MTTATESYPELPQTLAETGLSEEFLVDLTLKILYVHGARSGDQLAGFIKLPFPFVDDQLLQMQQRRLVEVRATQSRYCDRGTGAGPTYWDMARASRARALPSVARSKV